MFPLLLIVTLGLCQAVTIVPVYKGEIKIQGEFPDVVKSPIPKADVLPASWDWRSSGLMTTDLNQHIPTYWYFFYYYNKNLWDACYKLFVVFVVRKYFRGDVYRRSSVVRAGRMQACQLWRIGSRY